MSKQNFESALATHVTQVHKAPSPQRDLWPGIEHALNEPERSSKSSKPKASRLIAMAAAITLVGVSTWFVAYQHSAQVTSDQMISALEQKHSHELQGLLTQFKGRPALTKNWEEQLKELDEAAKAIKLALDNDPMNPTLLKMLQSVYQQQVQLVERVHVPKWSKV
ncbi:hypothetical protein [Echinimonas agarilytica]|uniref:Uncharacterized protein n=1 Tax=Echinimonas agarilytica TaxID=1215918 RepID=A0AA41W7H7_9GAMM|nr:hypothetical protein [Echinimonas agarilytica]MCM2680595.1 hypothetical protein [Echinimonas agarilytica]